MVKLLQKGYISFIFNLFSLQLYAHLEQYSSILNWGRTLQLIIGRNFGDFGV